MGIQPWYVGQTYPALQIALNTDSGTDTITGLVSTNFTMIIRNTSTNTDATGTGTFTIVTANPAAITYQFSNADVATAGNFLLYIKAIFPGNFVKFWDPITFTITAD